jgi:arylsulfatase A-like enzyme
VEGEDLAALVRQPSPERDRAALIMAVSPFAGYQAGKEFRGIRTSRYTYVRSVDGPWLLYDNETDPYQLDNLVARPEHAELKEALERRLQAELTRIGDVFRPRAHYIKKWRYHLDKRGCIPYTKTATVQSPGAIRPGD